MGDGDTVAAENERKRKKEERSCVPSWGGHQCLPDLLSAS